MKIKHILLIHTIICIGLICCFLALNGCITGRGMAQNRWTDRAHQIWYENRHRDDYRCSVRCKDLKAEMEEAGLVDGKDFSYQHGFSRVNGKWEAHRRIILSDGTVIEPSLPRIDYYRFVPMSEFLKGNR